MIVYAAGAVRCRDHLRLAATVDDEEFAVARNNTTVTSRRLRYHRGWHRDERPQSELVTRVELRLSYGGGHVGACRVSKRGCLSDVGDSEVR
jgi:hypothetical protein